MQDLNATLIPMQRLDVYVAAKELAKQVHEAGIRDAELHDQATRAAKSAFLNLCEGLGVFEGGNRRRHFGIALGSLVETLGAVDLASAIGVVDEAKARAIQNLGARVHAMCSRLRR